MREPERPYLPAAGHDWTLPLYDPLVKLLGGDRARRELVEQAALRAGQRVLEVGCGTGGLVALIQRLHPEVAVVGLDPDPKALARAKRKAQRAALEIQLDRGFADELPYPDASFDRVFSSFMLHHVPEAEKEDSLREARRVLKPGGELHLLDFLVRDTSGRRSLTHWLHSSHHLQNNSEGKVLALLRQAGFSEPRKVASRKMLVLKIAYYQGLAPISQATAA